MNSYEAFFARELRKLIQQERAERLDALAARVSVDEYHIKVGYLQALKWVLEEACEEVERKLRNPG